MKKCGAGGGGAIFDPKILYVFKKEKEKKSKKKKKKFVDKSRDLNPRPPG